MGAHQPVEVSDEELLGLLKQAVADLDAKAWVVGGYVRDKVLGRPHPNPDVVVERGDALKLAQRFAELAGAGLPVMFERFGTSEQFDCEKIFGKIDNRPELERASHSH